MIGLRAEGFEVVRGVVVDEAGQPVAGALVWVSTGMDATGRVPDRGRAETDAAGRFEVSWAAPAADEFTANWTFVWGWAEGRALVVQAVRGGSSDALRLVCGPADERRVQVVDAAGEPVRGARLASSSWISRDPPVFAELPEGAWQVLAVETDASGWCVLRGLFEDHELRVLGLELPGVGRLGWPVGFEEGGTMVYWQNTDGKAREVVVKLPRLAGIEGVVKDGDGGVVTGGVVEVWLKGNSYTEYARFWPEGGGWRTDEAGRLATGRVLPGGMLARVAVRSAGRSTALSDGMKLRGGEVLSVGEMKGARLGMVRGRVVGRDGAGIGGVVVKQRGAGPVWTEAVTDGSGRFEVGGVARMSGGSILVAGKEGYRRTFYEFMDKDFSDEVTITLARVNEAGVQPLRTGGEFLGEAERRALGRRLLEPLLGTVLGSGKDNHGLRFWTCRAMGAVDVGAALELVEKLEGQGEEARTLDVIKDRLARWLAPVDPDEAAGLIERISEPGGRGNSLAEVWDLLSSEQQRERGDWLERMVQEGRKAEPKERLLVLAQAMELLLEAGEEAQARAILEECRPLANAMPANEGDYELMVFASRAARLDRAAATAAAERIVDRETRERAFKNMAWRLVVADPEGADAALARVMEMERGSVLWPMAVELGRAGDGARAAALIERERSRGGEWFGMWEAGAWIQLAHALGAHDREAARKFARRGLDAFQQEAVRKGSGSWTRRGLSVFAFAPYLEELDAGMVGELAAIGFQGLLPGGTVARHWGLHPEDLAVFVGRYDRELAGRMFAETAARLERTAATAPEFVDLTDVQTLTVLDPARAVPVIERLPRPEGLTTAGSNWMRVRMAETIGLDAKRRWNEVWRTYGGLELRTRERDIY